MTSAQERAYHIAFGAHSRIPSCCVRFFIGEWEDINDWPEKPMNLYKRAVNASNAGYVQCPECLGSGNAIDIRDCRRECGKECARDFMSKAERGELT